jgi:hypothetical protein
MKVEVKKGGFKLPEEGQHSGVLIGLFHMGKQENLEKKLVDKVMLLFELDEVNEKEDNMTVNSILTLSMHEKSALRKVASTLMDRTFTDEEASDFELNDMIEKPCLIDIGRTAKGDRAKVINITRLPKQMQAVVPQNVYTDGKEPEWVDKMRKLFSNDIPDMD